MNRLICIFDKEYIGVVLSIALVLGWSFICQEASTTLIRGLATIGLVILLCLIWGTVILISLKISQTKENNRASNN